MTPQTLYIIAVLSFVILITEWLVRRTFLRHTGTALMVIIFTAVLANLGLVPTVTDAVPVPAYDAILGTVAPLGIVWLLLKVNLRQVLHAGLPIISIFLIGSLGTVAGVLAGMALVDGPSRIGPLFGPLGGMFTGTYTGGSVNFNAVAIEYDVAREGLLLGGAAAVDSIITTIWMAATLALPRWLMRFWPAQAHAGSPRASQADLETDVAEDTERMHPVDLACVLGIGLGTVWASEVLAGRLEALGISVPAILILTVIALILAQFKVVANLPGTRTLGLLAVYLFLCVIGALCDVRALASIGPLGLTLLVFAVGVVAVHGLVTFGAARLLKIDVEIAAVASQANVGGGTSALALARSLGRADLVLPAVLIGSLGNAIGTFLGIGVAELLPRLLG